MTQLWERFAERIDAMSLRERVWIFAGLVLVLVFCYELFVDAELRRERRIAAGLAQQQAEARKLEQQITALVHARQRDPDREARERLERATAGLADVNRRIAEEERRFTAPAQMQAVVEELVARNRGVTLVALKSLPPLSIAELRAQASGAGGAKPPAQGGDARAAGGRLVFRHGLEVTVSGTYLDLLAYLGDLEQLPTQLYWGAMELAVEQHPRIVLKFTVYTLSLDRAWMNV